MSGSARISRIEYALPDRVVTNADLQRENPDWRMDKVFAKTGVEERRFAAKDELASDLAFHAATKLLEGRDRAKVDGLIFCTQSADQIMPHNAALLHARLDLPKSVAAFDITLACSGFVYGLALAKSMVHSLCLRKVVVVCGDTYSRYMHPKDRSTIGLIGDGVAAILVEPSNEASGILDFDLGSDGKTGADKFMIKAGGLRVPRTDATRADKRDITGNVRSDETISMDGNAILAFAKREIEPSIRLILGRRGLAISDLKLVLFHQASLFTLETLNKQLGLAPRQTFSNIARIGNTVSASLPILLKDAETAGRLERGDLIMVAGYGVGFSWGSCLLKW